MSFSLETCLEEVLVETRLWKPESAPQATETNSSGNMFLPAAESASSVAPSAIIGAFIVAWPLMPSTKMPTTAHAIMTSIMIEVR